MAAPVWVLLMLAVPLSVDPSAGGSFAARLATLPGLLEVGLTLAATVLVLYALGRDLRGFRRVLRQPQFAALAAYYGLGLISALFSEYRLFALAYAGQALIGVGLTIVVFGELTENRRPMGMEVVYAAGAVACATAAALWIIRPEVVWDVYGEGQLRLRGIGLHPNQLGFLAGVLGIGGVRYGLDSRGARARIVAALMLALALPVLVAARGRTDTLGFVVGAAILLVLAGRWAWLVAGFGAAAIGLALVPGLGVRAFAYLNRGLQLPNLQGRLAVWGYLVNRSFGSVKGWLLGEGVGTSSHALRGISENWPNPGHAHNLFVEALHSLGIPGVVLVTIAVGAIGAGVVRLARQARQAGTAGPADLLAVFVLLVGASLLEHSLAGRANVYAFVGWALAGITAGRVPARAGGPT